MKTLDHGLDKAAGASLRGMESTDLMTRWNNCVGDLLIHRDSPVVLDRLLSHVSGCVGFDQWYAAEFRRRDRPRRIGYSGVRNSIDDYEDGIYLLDPFYQEYCRRLDPMVFRLDEISRPEFLKSRYFKKYIPMWETRDEVAYNIPVGEGFSLHLSLSRSMEMPAFQDFEVAFLKSLTGIIGALYHCHVTRASRDLVAPNVHDLIDGKIRLFGQDVLSPREQEVTHLLLKGFSAASIAAFTNISHGTAKNHIKSIYRKVGVSSQVDLLVRFFDDLYD